MNTTMSALLAVSHASAGEGDAHETAAEKEAEEYAPKWDQITFSAINLAIFLVILFFIARKPLSAAIMARSASIRSGLDEAARVKAEADARYAGVEVRLAALDKEIEEMRVDAREDAEREAETLVARGETEAARIRESAERAIREETARARSELRHEAVGLAVALAKETLARSMSREDQERLAREFLAAVDNDKAGAATGVSK